MQGILRFFVSIFMKRKSQKDKVEIIDFQKMVCYNQVRGESQIKF